MRTIVSHTGPQAMQRIKTLQDGLVIDSLIKGNIKDDPGQVTGLWKTDDIEDAVVNFNGFLCAVAAKGCRLSKAALLQRLKKLFKTDHFTLEDFAGKLSQALKYCHDKGKRMTSGRKTSQAVLKVIAAYGLKISKAAPSTSELEPEADDASIVSSQASDDADLEELFADGDADGGALAALQAAKGMYSSYDGSAAASSSAFASSSEVIDVADSPAKGPQVPHNPDEACACRPHE